MSWSCTALTRDRLRRTGERRREEDRGERREEDREIYGCTGKGEVERAKEDRLDGQGVRDVLYYEGFEHVGNGVVKSALAYKQASRHRTEQTAPRDCFRYQALSLSLS